MTNGNGKDKEEKASSCCPNVESYIGWATIIIFWLALVFVGGWYSPWGIACLGRTVLRSAIGEDGMNMLWPWLMASAQPATRNRFIGAITGQTGPAAGAAGAYGLRHVDCMGGVAAAAVGLINFPGCATHLIHQIFDFGWLAA